MSPPRRPVSFLFVNKHQHSESLTHEKGETAWAIKSHVSRQHRRLPRLRHGSPSPGPTGKKGTKLRKKHRGPPVDDLSPDRPSGRELMAYVTPPPRPVAAKGKSWDPFDASAARVSEFSTQCLQFYLAWMDPGNEMMKNINSGRPASSSVAVSLATFLPSEPHMHSFLACLAAMMEYVHVPGPGPYHTTRIIQKALKVLQASLSGHNPDFGDLVYDASFLCLAAQYRDDGEAVNVHRRAVVKLVDLAGGPYKLPPSAMELVLMQDTFVALASMTRPEFDLPPLSLPKPELIWTPNPTLNDLASKVLSNPLCPKPDTVLGSCLRAIMRCAQLSAYMWEYPETSADPAAQWMIWTLDISAHRLCKLSPHTHDPSPFNRSDTVRVALILWLPIILRSTANKLRGRRHYPRLKNDALFGPNGTWPSEVRRAIAAWNRALEKYATEQTCEQVQDERLVPELIDAVCGIEAYGDVQLGPFMRHFSDLVQHHKTKMRLMLPSPRLTPE